MEFLNQSARNCLCGNLRASALFIGWVGAIGGPILALWALFRPFVLNHDIQQISDSFSTSEVLEKMDEPQPNIAELASRAYYFAAVFTVYGILSTFLLLGTYKRVTRFVGLWLAGIGVMMLIEIAYSVIHIIDMGGKWDDDTETGHFFLAIIIFAIALWQWLKVMAFYVALEKETDKQYSHVHLINENDFDDIRID